MRHTSKEYSISIGEFDFSQTLANISLFAFEPNNSPNYVPLVEDSKELERIVQSLQHCGLGSETTTQRHIAMFQHYRELGGLKTQDEFTRKLVEDLLFLARRFKTNQKFSHKN